jgi:hypothetical protein
VFLLFGAVLGLLINWLIVGMLSFSRFGRQSDLRPLSTPDRRAEDISSPHLQLLRNTRMRKGATQTHALSSSELKA